ncbi:MAG: hypothetical protein DRP42_06500, partial [Tenericutes bacterium]
SRRGFRFWFSVCICMSSFLFPFVFSGFLLLFGLVFAITLAFDEGDLAVVDDARSAIEVIQGSGQK